MQLVWDDCWFQIASIAIFKVQMKIVIVIVKWNIPIEIKWSYKVPLIMLTIETRMADILWVHGPNGSVYVTCYFFQTFTVKVNIKIYQVSNNQLIIS